jgi:GH24 family phage-related lysozyme (muramidase)
MPLIATLNLTTTTENDVKVNEQGLALIRKFEGLRTGAYLDAAGVWTIGYGHTFCRRRRLVSACSAQRQPVLGTCELCL